MIINQDITIKNISKNVENKLDGYMKVLKESILHPDFITKYFSFKGFIELINNNFNSLNIFKEKAIIELNYLKKKYDKIKSNSQFDPNLLFSKSFHFINNKVQQVEKNFKNLMEQQNEKIFELKYEKNKLLSEFEKEYGEIGIDKTKNNNYNTSEMKNLNINTYETELNLIKEENKNLSKKLESYEKELIIMKSKVNLINEKIGKEKYEDNMHSKRGKNLKYHFSGTNKIKKYLHKEIGLGDLEHIMRKGSLNNSSIDSSSKKYKNHRSKLTSNEEIKNSPSYKKDRTNSSSNGNNLLKIGNKNDFNRTINDFKYRILKNHCYFNKFNKIEMTFDEANSLIKKRKEKENLKKSLNRNISSGKSTIIRTIRKVRQDLYSDDFSKRNFLNHQEDNLKLRNEKKLFFNK
jgi:hypothetical protein